MKQQQRAFGRLSGLYKKKKKKKTFFLLLYLPLPETKHQPPSKSNHTTNLLFHLWTHLKTST
jgi:hypothetical protein